MKKQYFSMLMIFVGLCIQNFVLGQGLISATYAYGDIPTSFLYNEDCTGPSKTLAITLPAGDNIPIDSISVSYTMTATNGGWMQDQRSYIYCQNTGLATSIIPGTGASEGTQSYMYSNSTITAGTFGGGSQLIFEMRAWRTWEGIIGCHTTVNKVDLGTWSITVHYAAAIENPKVGVQTNSPAMTLDVNGKIKLADDTTAPVEGTMRYNSETKNFEGFDGEKWLSFTSTSTSGWGSNPLISENAYRSPYAISGSGLKFGTSIGMYQEYAIIGAPGSGNGFADVLIKDSTWIHQDRLLANDGVPEDKFGQSVAIHKNYAVVGAPAANAVYVFIRSGTTWTQSVKINCPNATENSFGSAVDLHGDYFIVSSYKYPDVITRIYRRTSLGWIQSLSETFGMGEFPSFDLSITDTHAAIGRYFPANGEVYLYSRTNTSWARDTIIEASDAYGGQYFGYDVSVDEHKCAVTSRNRIYILKYGNGLWTETHKIAVSGGGNFSSYESLDLQNDILVVGTSDFGACAYVFEYNGVEWCETAKLKPSDYIYGDAFGRGCTLYNNDIIIGATLKDNGIATNQGVIYIFQR